MAEAIFLLQDNGSLVEMSEARYDSEAVLQQLLAAYPNLIPGGQIDAGAARRWLLVCREVSLASDADSGGRWSVDHLFLDQDGVPTLIEVKRSTDTRIRREVVGQMLDYGANAVLYWPVETIRSHYESRCERDGLDAEETPLEHVGEDGDVERFWSDVRTNLQAGKIRMVFEADSIPPELRRIVEFLNGQMQPAEVLAVEIRQFSGDGVKTFVPRLIGQTAQAQQKKQSGSPGRVWEEASFLEDLGRRKGPGEVGVARALLGWAKERSVRLWLGKGKSEGSFFCQPDWKGETRWLISVWTDGTFAVVFEQMKTRPPFDSLELRLELLNRLRAVLGPAVDLQDRDADRRRHFPLGLLAGKERLEEFIGVLDWALEQIRR